jgi:hypothetical protein
MPYEKGQLSLMAHLGMAPMQQVMKTSPSGETYIGLYDFFEVLSHLYETGAILGRAKRHKLNALAKICVTSGTGATKLKKLVQEKAKERLEKFKNEVGREPDVFSEFILSRELESATGLSLTDINQADGMEKLAKVRQEKWPIEKAEPFIKAFGYEGIGFGSLYPKLTEKMCRNASKNIDRDKLLGARDDGLTIPGTPTVTSFEQRERSILLMVALYAQVYYPELLESLGLQEIIEEEIEKVKE